MRFSRYPACCSSLPRRRRLVRGSRHRLFRRHRARCGPRARRHTRNWDLRSGGFSHGIHRAEVYDRYDDGAFAAAARTSRSPLWHVCPLQCACRRYSRPVAGRSGIKCRGQAAEEISLALRQDRAEAIVLGCAGMADLTAELRSEFGVPVIDGVAAAVKQAESLVSMGLSTAKRGAYATPLAKPYRGLLEAFGPDRLSGVSVDG